MAQNASKTHKSEKRDFENLQFELSPIKITENKFSNSPTVITNIEKCGLVSKDPNAVKCGLHEVVRSLPLLAKRSEGEGAKRVHTLLTLVQLKNNNGCLLYTSPSPRDA